MSNNRVCMALGIEKPIIQGPMAWVSNSPLVAAVSENGGLGVLGVGFAPLEIIRAEIIATKKLTNNPFGINVFLIPELVDNVTQIALEEKPPVIYADTLYDLDYDLSKKYFDIWKEAGIKIVVKASTIKDALTAQRAGADVVIVKGWEGGGHTTYEATTVLIPQAADCLTVPIVGSGGIADGRGMAAAIALGADGIEMGTVFMCAKETPIHENVKQAMLKAGDMETVVTGYCTGEPCRQLKNRLSDEMLKIEDCHNKREASVKLIEISQSSLRIAMTEGEIDEKGAVMAGQIVPLITEVKSAKEIIDFVMKGYHDTVLALSKFEV